MTKAEILAQLEKEFSPMKAILGQAADTILNENVSNYPIFVAHKQHLEIGIPLLSDEDKNQEWSVNASTLEEFVAKKIVLPEKIDEFKKIYKPVGEYVCLFVLSELGATFIFISRT